MFKRTKNNSKPVVRQILDLIPNWLLKSCVRNNKSDKGCSKYFAYDQLVALTFGQLNKCSTLKDISASISLSGTFIQDLGLKQSPAASTMSDGNAKRSYKVFEQLYFRLLSHYKAVLIKQGRANIIEEVKDKTIKIIDSTTISLCLSMFNWAKFRTAKGGIKIHTGWDDALMLPDIINISEAKVHDAKGIDNNVFPQGTIVIEDKGYFDFTLMANRIKAKNIFVTRIKENTTFETVEILETDVDEQKNRVLLDETIRLTSLSAIKAKLDKHILRKVTVYDELKNEHIDILTNNLEWSSETIAALYKKRWDIELFFKALKQNLQVKTFTGTSENAVKSQIYVAMICFLLVELMRRNICKTTQALSNLYERIRICFAHYLSLKYICNSISKGAQRIIVKPPPELFKQDLFSS